MELSPGCGRSGWAGTSNVAGGGPQFLRTQVALVPTEFFRPATETHTSAKGCLHFSPNEVQSPF